MTTRIAYSVQCILLLALLLCASCQTPTWGGAADILMPDELTIGQGNTTGVANGGYSGHSNMFEYEGESESTYAALTWSLPSFEDENLSRDERRAIRDFYASVDEESDAEETTVEVSPLEFKLPEMKGRKPPTSVIYGLVGFLAIMMIVVVRKSRKKDPWS